MKYSIRDLLRTAVRKRTHRRPTKPFKKSFRPGVEVLEDRVVPSTTGPTGLTVCASYWNEGQQQMVNQENVTGQIQNGIELSQLATNQQDSSIPFYQAPPDPFNDPKDQLNNVLSNMLTQHYATEMNNYVWTVNLGSATGGAFTLSVGGQTTTLLTYNPSAKDATPAATDVQSALEQLSTVGSGNVEVDNPSTGVYTVRFEGGLADQSKVILTGDGSFLTGGTLTVGQGTMQQTILDQVTQSIPGFFHPQVSANFPIPTAQTPGDYTASLSGDTLTLDYLVHNNQVNISVDQKEFEALYAALIDPIGGIATLVDGVHFVATFDVDFQIVIQLPGTTAGQASISSATVTPANATLALDGSPLAFTNAPVWLAANQLLVAPLANQIDANSTDISSSLTSVMKQLNGLYSQFGNYGMSQVNYSTSNDHLVVDFIEESQQVYLTVSTQDPEFGGFIADSAQATFNLYQDGVVQDPTNLLPLSPNGDPMGGAPQSFSGYNVFSFTRYGTSTYYIDGDLAQNLANPPLALDSTVTMQAEIFRSNLNSQNETQNLTAIENANPTTDGNINSAPQKGTALPANTLGLLATLQITYDLAKQTATVSNGGNPVSGTGFSLLMDSSGASTVVPGTTMRVPGGAPNDPTAFIGVGVDTQPPTDQPQSLSLRFQVPSKVLSLNLVSQAPPPHVTGPANHLSTAGVFDATTGTWYLRDVNSGGAPDVTPFRFGAPGWVSVVGDWDGNGTTTIGVVDPATMTWYLKNSGSAGGADVTPFAFGAPGWIPVVGDWNGTGHTGIGAFDPATGTFYLRNEDSPGAPDAGIVRFGGAGWSPVVGDWDGNGTTTVGVVNPTTMTWYLKNSNSASTPDIAPFAYGAPGWLPMAGDWNGAGTTTVGVVDPASETWYLRDSSSGGAPDVATFAFGAPGWTPLAGNWSNSGQPLRLAGDAATVPGASPLTSDDLSALFGATLARAQADGLSPALTAQLATTQFTIGQLGGGELALASPGQVVLDATAAGHGWFVDPTPAQDEEFSPSASGALQALPGGPADGHVDLLTAVFQELGQEAGLTSDALTAPLATGVRNVAALDTVFAAAS